VVDQVDHKEIQVEQVDMVNDQSHQKEKDKKGYIMTYLHTGKDMLGESPLWHPVHEKFFWSDVWNKKIWSLEMPADGSEPSDENIKEYPLKNGVSGMAPK